MTKNFVELFSYQTLGGSNWASVAINTQTGRPHTVVYGEICVGGGRGINIISVGSEISFDEIYDLALIKQKNDFCSWFEPELYKNINGSNWKEFIEEQTK